MICGGKPSCTWRSFWLALVLGLLVFGAGRASAQETFEQKLNSLERILTEQLEYSETLETSLTERELLLSNLRNQIEGLKSELTASLIYQQNLIRRLVAIERQFEALETEHKRALQSSINLEQAAIRERRSKRIWQIIAGVAVGGAIYVAVQ